MALILDVLHGILDQFNVDDRSRHGWLMPCTSNRGTPRPNARVDICPGLACLNCGVRTLRACSTVCQLWRPICQRRLFRKVRIRGSTKILGFTSILRASPHPLSDYVLRLELDGTVSFRDFESPTVLFGILAQFRNLEDLVVVRMMLKLDLDLAVQMPQFQLAEPHLPPVPLRRLVIQAEPGADVPALYAAYQATNNYRDVRVLQELGLFWSGHPSPRPYIAGILRNVRGSLRILRLQLHHDEGMYSESIKAGY